MKYERFEDTPAWQAGVELTVEVFALTEDKAFRRKGDIANQIQRAALSVPNNIAEGFERGTTQELITFLYYSRGSAGEVRSILCVCERIPAFAHLKSQILNLKASAESISRQVRAWADALQNSDITGQRHLTDSSRRAYKQRQSASEFSATLKKANEENLKRILKERGQPPGPANPPSQI